WKISRRTQGRTAARLRGAGPLARSALAQSRLAGPLSVPFSGNMNPAFLKTAERIGARLCRDAVWYQGRTNWTSDFLDGESIAHRALDPDLYSGTAGIALFLWRLAKVTGERIFRVTA